MTPASVTVVLGLPFLHHRSIRWRALGGGGGDGGGRGGGKGNGGGLGNEQNEQAEHAQNGQCAETKADLQ